ncbi:MAG: penicillin-binding transpeptidase domain-containing protein [Polyangiaceae bacterium]|jgi:cell division protein FtsI/penicillin-binding protein 2
MRGVRLLAALFGALIACVAMLALRHAWTASRTSRSPESVTPPLAQTQEAPRSPEPGPHAPAVTPALESIDLTRLATDEQGVAVPVTGGMARLTLDADLQNTAASLVAAAQAREAAVVLMDVATGRILAYASHVEDGPARDLCVEATAPSASLFKIVTAAALIEDAHLGPTTRQCYSGGARRVFSADLVDDPARDRWCATLAVAMGRSLNTVFARLAAQYLVPRQVDEMAHRFGYGRPLEFDVPVQASAVHVPKEPLEFARTAAGFWNSTLSPLEAAEMSAIVARGGETIRPRIVDSIVGPSNTILWTAPEEASAHRVLERETAEAVAEMMTHTVTEGTSRRAFHDAKGQPFLPGVTVAGKTGTLADAGARRYYTWFSGFAPATPSPGTAQVAIAALVINGPVWKIKANVLARDVLRAYFASQGTERVSRPGEGPIARSARR